MTDTIHGLEQLAIRERGTNLHFRLRLSSSSLLAFMAQAVASTTGVAQRLMELLLQVNYTLAHSQAENDLPFTRRGHS